MPGTEPAAPDATAGTAQGPGLRADRRLPRRVIREGLQEEATREQRDCLEECRREREWQEGRSVADTFTE